MLRNLTRVAMCLCLPAATAMSATIVNNSTTSPTGEDSLSLVFYSLDSLGNPTTADSLYILVTGPDGAIVYCDSLASPDSRVTATTIRGKQFYSFADQVSNLDGNGNIGGYVITLLAKNNSTSLLTPNTYSFQVVSTELSDQLALIDSGAVAAWVWNTPQLNHTATGTFGRYLDTEISGLGPGSGAYSYTIVAFDTSIGLNIPYALLTIRNVSQTALIASAGTGSAGYATFNLDPDSFVVTTTAPGYSFDAYDTIVVAGAGSDTLFGDQFDPGQPQSPAMCRVYGWLYNLNGKPDEGAQVSAFLPSGVVQYSVVIISPFEITTTTDSSGYFYFDLLPSDSLTPPGVKYEFTISRTDGSILRQRLEVPDSTQWRLTW
ncbi:MAG: hypothetical protein AB1744_08340 [Candidatus Zixiibacteriota bacterium]